MKILHFFFSLISLYNNRNQWQLQRSIFEKNHTFYWTPGAAYYLFPDTTMFIHYSKCFFALCTKYGNQPTITSFKDQHQYSISWSFIQKTIELFAFTVCWNISALPSYLQGWSLREVLVHPWPLCKIMCFCHEQANGIIQMWKKYRYQSKHCMHCSLLIQKHATQLEGYWNNSQVGTLGVTRCEFPPPPPPHL